MPKIKWSAFPNVGTNISGDTVVGLRAGSNVEFSPITPAQLQSNTYSFAVDTGVANAYVANLTPAVASLTNGLGVLVEIVHANTGPSTLTVNGHTASIVTSNNKALAVGELIANQIALFVYDATWNKFILLNSSYSNTTSNTITASGGTTVLTNNSADIQIINGTNYQIIQMPDTSTLALGRKFTIINNGTGTAPGFAINDSTGTFMMNCFPGVQYTCTCISTSDTTFTGWDIAVNIFSIQKLQGYGNFQFTNTPSDVNYVNFTQGVSLINIATPVGGKYFNNLLQISVDQTTPPTTTIVDAGNAQSTGTFPFGFGPGLTTLIGNELLTNSNLNLQTSTLTTVTLPKYIWNQGNINLGNCNFAVLNFAELLWATVITFNTTTFTSFSIPKCQGIRSNLAFTSATVLTTFSAPLCVLVGGSITGTANVLTTFTFTVLKYIWGNFTLTAAALTTLSLPALVSIYGTWGTTMAACTSVDLSLLQNVTGAVTASFATLTTLNLPAIVSFGAAVTFTAANMTTFSLGATLKSVGGNWTMTGMKLNQASVDGILISLAALDGTNGTTAYSSKTVNLSGGTSSAPSATGLAAKATLVARGCTVTTN